MARSGTGTRKIAVGVLDRLLNQLFRRPAAVVPMLFALVSFAGAALLSLPQATEKGVPTPFVDAWFTAMSAVCVTGLSTLDVPNHWSFLGEATILALIQLGGLGIMSATVLIIAMFSQSLGFGVKRGLASENAGVTPGNARSLLRVVARFTFGLEALIALWLMLWLWIGHATPFAEAVWKGLFHAVSAFNNAGFALWSDNLMSLAGDWMFLSPIMVAVIAGGIGYPVFRDLWMERGWRRLSVHGRLTLIGYAALFAIGALLFTLLEWRNPETLGDMPTHARVLNGLFQSVSARTAGFNGIDLGKLGDQALMLTTILMFIGGGSAGTAGGVKVGTIMLLILVVWSEVRGKADVEAFGRRIDERIQRRAVAIVVLSALLVSAAAYGLVALSPHLGTKQVVFEAVSAFATVGLSTGITAQFSDAGKYLLIFLMFVGRVGAITLFAALAMRAKPIYYRYPREDVIVG